MDQCSPYPSSIPDMKTLELLFFFPLQIVPIHSDLCVCVCLCMHVCVRTRVTEQASVPPLREFSFFVFPVALKGIENKSCKTRRLSPRVLCSLGFHAETLFHRYSFINKISFPFFYTPFSPAFRSRSDSSGSDWNADVCECAPNCMDFFFFLRLPG